MATEGPKLPLTTVDDSSIGTIAWTNPNDSQTENGTSANVTLQSQASHYLKVTNFGFNIPVGATILGIECEYKVNYVVNSGSVGSITKSSRIVKGGVIGTTIPSPSFNVSSGALAWSTSGANNYLWGETWTPADINSSGFGTTIRFAENSGANLTFNVDAVRITVTYSLPVGPYLTIAGVNYLPYYKSNSAVIRETLRKTNVMNLNIVTKGIASAPQEGSEVVFKDGIRFLFGGYISRVQPDETGKGSLFNFAVEVSDYSYIFNSKIARRAYTNQTLLYIVTDLINTYVGSVYGFDLTNVQTGPTIDTISFDHISIRKCFEKISKLTGYVWWVDYEKKLYFQTQTTSAAPETVTDSSGNVESININYDISQVRNSVTVIGSSNGEQSLDILSETFNGDDETRAWELSEKPSQVVSITLNGTPQQFSLDLNERDTDIFVYSFTGKSFRLTNTPTTPTVDDTIVITYYPRIPIIEKLTDPASIAFFAALDGGNGIYEYTVRDSSIGSIQEANARAKQELEEYSMPLVDGKITTRTGLLTAGSIFKPGQALTVNLPTQGLATDTVFMIQEVQIQVLDGTTAEYFYTIKFGGKIVGIQEFLESLASQQTEGEVSNEDEILTIENISDSLQMSDEDVAPSMSKDTPPYHYTSGSPIGKYNLSEWS